MITKNPKTYSDIKTGKMVLAKLDVLIMPNGEMLCAGEHITWLPVSSNIVEQLSDFKDAITGEPV